MSDTKATEFTVTATSPSAEEALTAIADIIEDIKGHVYYPAFPTTAAWERSTASGDTVVRVSLFQSEYRSGK